MTAWVTGGAMVLGTAMNAYGANKAAKAQKTSEAANRAAQDEANKVEWVNYLMSRGIKPKGPVKPGEMPTDYETVNARLPLWAKLTIPNPQSASALLPRTPSVAASPMAGPIAPVRRAVPTLRRMGGSTQPPGGVTVGGNPAPVDFDRNQPPY